MSKSELREKDLREMAKCAACKRLFGVTGAPMFFRVSMTSYCVDLGAVQRASGLQMMLGNAMLGMAMGPDEVMARRVLSGEVTLCSDCAAVDIKGPFEFLNEFGK